MSDLKKKNKCDLEYNTYCQFFNTTIIVSITILLGMLLTILTGQIKIGSNPPFIFALITSFAILAITIYLLTIIHDKMEAKKEEIQWLNI